jgi:peptidoglycan/xylan/chitin deacetylase (PgdA/CDA1 family)
MAMVVAATVLGSVPVQAETRGAAAAVVFAYDRFGEDRTPGASIGIDSFEHHLEELRDDAYSVLPLDRIVEALREGKPLPERAIAITIDGTARSAYREAYPRLRAAGFPFTVFVATDILDRGLTTTMGWSELREMAAAGVNLGALGASGQPMAGRSPGELESDLDRMTQRFREELGQVPSLFAYPHGEYSLTVRRLIEQRGFRAAFGQQSGVAHGRGDPFTLPRFVMNEAFGSIDRFTLAANALPLMATDITPADPVLRVNPPILGFTIPDRVGDLARLACFASGQGRAAVERLDANRIEVRIADPFPSGRARINCTLPADDERWRWFGVQFFIPE